jgi:dolichol-phosphate mannosyltransferase
VRLLAARSVVALIPCHREPPARELVERAGSFVGGVLLVDDGSPTPAAVARLADETGSECLCLPRNSGKGHAVAAGLAELLGRSRPPEAVLVLDSDGQHPPEAIPAFLEAADEAELIVGDRFGDLKAMPWERRLMNRLATRLLSLLTGQPVRDSQCGMRLLRGRALREIPFPAGGFEAETVHLKRCLRGGVRVGWVPIPAVYAGQVSSFRALRDSRRVLAALLG